MINAFKTILQARGFLKLLAGKSASKDIAIKAWVKKTGHSKTILSDMARKKSATANPSIKHSKKYR